MTLMSQSDFAKHIGADRSYVTQLKNAGRLVMQDGKVDVEASILRIESTKDPGKVGVAARHEEGRKQKQAGLDSTPDIEAPSGKAAGSVYQTARAASETYRAKMLKLAHDKEIGLLLAADEARAAVADGDTLIRNRLEALPDLLAPQLAAEADEQKIRSLLMDHIESLLGDLSRSFYNLAK